MSLASRVALFADRLSAYLRVTRGTFTPTSNVSSHDVRIRKQCGIVTVEADITLAAPLAGGTQIYVGQIPSGFRSTKTLGTGAYFYNPVGAAGGVIVAPGGTITVLNDGDNPHQRVLFSIAFEAS